MATIAVAGIEALIGIGLLTRYFRAASYVSLITTAVFAAKMLTETQEERHACGCFGSLDVTLPSRVAVLVALAMFSAMVAYDSDSGKLVRRSVAS